MSDAAPVASTSLPAEPTAATTAAEVTRVVPAGPSARAWDTLAVETPVALRYNGTSHVVMMASPADLVDFAYGFSLAEGVVAGADEVSAVTTEPVGAGIAVAIQIPDVRARALRARSRNLPGRTGCGLCGVTEIETALRPLPNVPATLPYPAGAIDTAVNAIAPLQAANRASGALHAAAFADRQGRVLTLREDVGRHNALDKLIGSLARAAIAPTAGFVVVTSRCSMEMVQKTATFGCPMIVALSAPTALAVRLADRANITVCAFARGAGCNVYSHAETVTS
ncbi:MAG: formate dehydrogenase accessory sulfurtransferase FdhD [Pseudomonadota bacterium]